MAFTPFIKSIWGGATAFLDRSRRFGAVDLLVVLGFMGAVASMLGVAREWTGEMRPTVEIDLSPRALPLYTLYSLSRGLLAYALSLAFTLVYGYWAAKDRLAERVLVPMLDILQSIPVLSFMPGLVLALVALFPTSNVGLELASVVMIFTGQAWNMTFSYFHSLRSVPSDQSEVATAYRFTWWQRLRWVELPFATIGLVWNSMMSMAGGWFFLTVTEAFVLGSRDFRLPGLGSYMSVAVSRGDVPAMLWAVFAMVAMIVLLDQLLWRPVVVWAQKFRMEEGGGQESATSWFLDWLRRSRIVAWLRERMERSRKPKPRRRPEPAPIRAVATRPSALTRAVFTALVGALLWGAVLLFRLLSNVGPRAWGELGICALATLGRVLAALAIGTAWALPAGIAIGLSPRLSRVLQPVVQVVASFPAPMLFPAVVAVLQFAGVSLNAGAIALMLLGTQWYILFNVIAGTMAIPADLQEAARSYRIEGRQRFRQVLLPAVFPYLVTGWVTAAGGAWNASIVAEVFTFRGKTLTAFGIGARISEAAEQGNFPMLAAGTVLLAAMVVTFNRMVWRRLYRIAESRYSLTK